MTFPPIADLLPHRPPMLLLDAVVAHDEESVQCTVSIRESSTFYEPGGVPAWVALEYCAQAIAAFAGLKARSEGGQPRMGLLVAAREFSLQTSVFAAGDELLVRAHREFGEERVGRFACQVLREGVVVANASLSVYLPEA
jgi:predicted hotdog family 3-hydroxylacyl-ACP dehydratase